MSFSGFHFSQTQCTLCLTKKNNTLFLITTSANTDQFQKFYH